MATQGMIDTSLGIKAALEALRQSAISDDNTYRTQWGYREARYKSDRAAFMTWVQEYINARHQREDLRQLLPGYWPCSGLLPMVVDTGACAYMAAPKRVLLAADGSPIVAPVGSDPPPELQAFEQFAADTDLDSAWIIGDRKSYLLQGAYQRIQWDPVEWRPTVETIGPHLLWGGPDPQAPDRIQTARWLGIKLPADTTNPYSRLFGQGDRWEVYARADPDDLASPVQCVRTDNLWQITGAQPALGELPDYPFVRVCEFDADRSLWPRGGDDLETEPDWDSYHTAAQRYNALLHDCPALLMAGWSQEAAARVTAGPGAVIPHDDPSAHAEYLALPAGADPVVQQSEARGQWGQTRGIPPQEFRVDTVAESGIARYIARMPLLEKRKQRIRRYPGYEAELWRLAAQVRQAGLAVQTGRPPAEIPAARWVDAPRLTETKLQVSFSEVQPTLTPMEEFDLWTRRVAAGLESVPARMVAEGQVPNLQAAEEELAKRRAATAPLAPESQSQRRVADNLDAIMREGTDDGS